jgi:hypothetical protein
MIDGETDLYFKNMANSQKNMFDKRGAEDREVIAKRFFLINGVRLAKIYDIDGFEALLDDPKCAKCGTAATNRCSLCKNEWYCSRPCQVKCWPDHKSICELLRN